MGKTIVHYFEIEPPSTFANINQKNGQLFKTQEEAEKYIQENFGDVPKESEYYDYWQDISSKCKILKIHKEVEEVKRK